MALVRPFLLPGSLGTPPDPPERLQRAVGTISRSAAGAAAADPSHPCAGPSERMGIDRSVPITCDDVVSEKAQQPKILGEGTYGSVAMIRHSNAKYARKRVVVNRADVSIAIAELIVRNVDHPNVVGYCGARLSEDHVDLYMDTAGSTLHTKYTSGGKGVVPMGTDSTLVTAYQMIAGLCHLSDRGIIHGDVKPENFLVFDEIVSASAFAAAYAKLYPSDARRLPNKDFAFSRVVISDFSIATPFVCGGRTLLLARYPFIYRPPEVFVWKDVVPPIRKSADVWACGTTIAEMSIGAEPYERVALDLESDMCISQMFLAIAPPQDKRWNWMRVNRREQFESAVAYLSKKKYPPGFPGLRKHASEFGAKLPELFDLFSNMCNPDPTARPTFVECIRHPAFDRTLRDFPGLRVDRFVEAATFALARGTKLCFDPMPGLSEGKRTIAALSSMQRRGATPADASGGAARVPTRSCATRIAPPSAAVVAHPIVAEAHVALLVELRNQSKTMSMDACFVAADLATEYVVRIVPDLVWMDVVADASVVSPLISLLAREIVEGASGIHYRLVSATKSAISGSAYASVRSAKRIAHVDADEAEACAGEAAIGASLYPSPDGIAFQAMVIAELMDFDLHRPTAYTFLCEYFSNASLGNERFRLACAAAWLCACDIAVSMTVPPAVVAATAMVIATGMPFTVAPDVVSGKIPNDVVLSFLSSPRALSLARRIGAEDFFTVGMSGMIEQVVAAAGVLKEV